MFRKKYLQKKNPYQQQTQVITNKIILVSVFVGLLVGALIFFSTENLLTSIIGTILGFGLLFAYSYARVRYGEAQRIKSMEAVFPDFLQLMSSNLRAGMTTDNALLLSSRKEFTPLDKEITKLGKDIVTGKHIEQAMLDMADRIQSEKIQKTINLLVSGIRSGGNMAILLEETAINMRERNFVEKKAASNVLMYVIFIFFAAAIGAPALFGLSAVLVQILSDVLATIPPVDTATAAKLPFTLSAVSVSPTFVMYFALVFLVTTNIIGSLVIGLVSKGEEREGIKYMLPIIILSLAIFFVTRVVLLNFFSGFFA